MSPFIPSYVRDDGTFCVAVRFETTQDSANLRNQVTVWCNEWVIDNGKLSRHPVSDDYPSAQCPDYLEIFTGPPYVTKTEDHHLWLRFDGTYSYWWRDWFVRLLSDLTRAIPSLRADHGQRLAFSCDQEV